jgi:hypothetical protein
MEPGSLESMLLVLLSMAVLPVMHELLLFQSTVLPWTM